MKPQQADNFQSQQSKALHRANAIHSQDQADKLANRHFKEDVIWEEVRYWQRDAQLEALLALSADAT